MSDLLHKDGPLQLVAFIAAPLGRWAFLRSLDHPAAKTVLNTLKMSDCDSENAFAARPTIVGLGIVRSWRFVHQKFGSVQSRTLADAAQAARARQGAARFLEHEVIESVHVRGTEVGRALQMVMDNNPFMGEHQWLISARNIRGNVFTPDNQVQELGRVLNGWMGKYESLYGHGLTNWTVWGPFAVALAIGAWKWDISVIRQRQSGDEVALRAPTLPSPKSLAAFKATRSVLDMPALPDDSEPVAPDQVMHQRGFVFAYTASSMLRALRFSRHLKTLEDLKIAAIDGAELYHHFAQDGVTLSLGVAQDVQMPSRWALARGRVILDIATMLAQRSLKHVNGPSYRYFGFDASPQRSGVEVFATLERSVLKSSMGFDDDGELYPAILGTAITRKLPLMALGQGRAALSDKVRGHANQVWLERGGNLQDYLEANLDVRGVISDMGTEAGIGNYVDISHELFGNVGRPMTISSFNGFLYPLALSIPGPQHAVDNVVKDVVGDMKWFPEWAAAAKSLCQWVNQSGHRDKLKDILRHRDDLPEDVDQVGLGKALDTGCERFASWRWKTVTLTTSSLLRLKSALVHTIGACRNNKDLGVSDRLVALSLIQTVNSSTFWSRTRALSKCFQPLGNLSGWLSGCECHEQERMEGKAIRCQWQGVRGPELHEKLASVKKHYDHLRRAGGRVGDVLGDDILDVANSIMSSLALKFMWLNDIEFQIWKVVLGTSVGQYIFLRPPPPHRIQKTQLCTHPHASVAHS